MKKGDEMKTQLYNRRFIRKALRVGFNEKQAVFLYGKCHGEDLKDGIRIRLEK